LIGLTLLLLAVAGLVLWHVPRDLRWRYCATFRARHGLAVQVGLAVLAAATFSTVLATALSPGHSLMELVDALVVGGLETAGLVDLVRFSRR
jgi:hypothetical protein